MCGSVNFCRLLKSFLKLLELPAHRKQRQPLRKPDPFIVIGLEDVIGSILQVWILRACCDEKFGEKPTLIKHVRDVEVMELIP